MSKLSSENKFLDLSDYGRPLAKVIAKGCSNTTISAIQVTWMFVVCAFISIYFIIQEKYLLAGIFLILKSVLDAADGELARMKSKPSYVGRYFDSIADFLINLVLFLTIAHVTTRSYIIALIAFAACQLQGTLYNYYYVILRNRTFKSDKTSRVFENTFPVAFPGESQKVVTVLFIIYKIFYGPFDWIIYTLERSASKVKLMPKWFMTLLSIYGLGFQLLLIALFFSLNMKEFILLFFIVYSFFIPLFIGIRKIFVA